MAPCRRGGCVMNKMMTLGERGISHNMVSGLLYGFSCGAWSECSRPELSLGVVDNLDANLEINR